MKSTLLLIIALLFSTTAFSQTVSCLGFPSAQKFNCMIKNGDIIEVNIPAGHGCMQGPAKGTITFSSSQTVSVSYPSTYYTGVKGILKKVFTYYLNSEKLEAEKIVVQCEDYDDLG